MIEFKASNIQYLYRKGTVTLYSLGSSDSSDPSDPSLPPTEKIANREVITNLCFEEIFTQEQRLRIQKVIKRYNNLSSRVGTLINYLNRGRVIINPSTIEKQASKVLYAFIDYQ